MGFIVDLLGIEWYYRLEVIILEIIKKVLLLIDNHKIRFFLYAMAIFIFPLSIIAIIYALGDITPLIKTHFSASDILDYSVSFFIGFSTLLLGLLAISQNDKINSINEKLLKLEEERENRSTASVVDITINDINKNDFIYRTKYKHCLAESEINFFIENDDTILECEYMDEPPLTDLYDRINVKIEITNYTEAPIKKIEAFAYIKINEYNDETHTTTYSGLETKFVSHPVYSSIVNKKPILTYIHFFIPHKLYHMPEYDIISDKIAFRITFKYTNIFNVSTYANMVCKYHLALKKYYFIYSFDGMKKSN